MQFDQIYEISYVGDLQRPSMNLSKEIPKNLPIFMVVKDENSQYNMLYRSPQHVYIYKICIPPALQLYGIYIYISILTPLEHRSSTTTK